MTRAGTSVCNMWHYIAFKSRTTMHNAHNNAQCTQQCTMHTTMHNAHNNAQCTQQCTMHTTMHNAHNNAQCTMHNAHILTFFILITHHLREIAFIQSILLRNGSHCEPWLTIYGGHVTMRLTCDQMEMAVTWPRVWHVTRWRWRRHSTPSCMHTIMHAHHHAHNKTYIPHFFILLTSMLREIQRIS